MPNKVKALFEKTILVAFGTADNDGNPNTIPIFWKKIIDEDRIILIDNFMRATKENILKNNKVCVSFWDPQTEEAYKLKGVATYYKEGTIYELGKKFIQSKKPEHIPRGVVEIKVNEIFDICPGPNAGVTI